MGVAIRPATPADAAAILRIHYEAIHETAASSYSQEILDAWHPAGAMGRNPQRLLDSWTEGEEMVVATIDDAVVGFSSIFAADSELRSVYVDPKYGRKGVGTWLLQEAEHMARSCGLKFLHLDSSLNAEAFYAKHGYSVVERSVFTLRDGPGIPCVVMRKEL